MAKTEKQPVDLAQFDEAVKKQGAGILVPILGMDGRTPLGFSIRVAGPDSDRAKQAQDDLSEELIDQQNMARMSARDAAQRGLRYLAKITMGWEKADGSDGPAIVLDGEALAYSEENAVKLYQRFAFIKEQVDRAAGSRARFLKG